MSTAAKKKADTVTLPRAEYEVLLSAAEDAGDRAAGEDAAAGRGTYFPMEVVKRIVAGDNKLRVFRHFRGLTLAELAAATGVGKAQLSHIETGRRRGSVDALSACARALDVGLDDLV